MRGHLPNLDVNLAPHRTQGDDKATHMHLHTIPIIIIDFDAVVRLDATRRRGQLTHGSVIRFTLS